MTTGEEIVRSKLEEGEKVIGCFGARPKGWFMSSVGSLWTVLFGSQAIFLSNLILQARRLLARLIEEERQNGAA